MARVVIGKIEEVKLKNGEAVVRVKNQQLALSNKAMWGLLRRHYTRQIDAEIRDRKESFLEENETGDWSEEFKHFFVEKMREAIAPWSEVGARKLQFILDEGAARLLAVATLRHSLMRQDEVYEIVKKTVRELNLETGTEETLLGKLILLKKTEWADYGLQVVAGDIKTQKAISISLFVRAKRLGQGCLNPLAFLNLNRRLTRQLLGKNYQVKIPKVLRFEHNTQIAQRLKSSLQAMRPEIEKLQERVENHEFPEVDLGQARYLLAAMGSTYGLGAKVLRACLTDFKNREEHTLKTLSMSASQVVKHQNEVFKKGTEKAKQHLADIAGAFLLIDEVEGATKKSRERVRESDYAKSIYENLG